MIRLPAPEPIVFTGDPLKYPGWKTDFTSLTEQRKVPPTERIHYLKKYLGGAAKEAVENYFLLASDNAYQEAKKLLDERFGAAYVVGNALRYKLESWPKIANRDANALQRFSDFVKQCETAMGTIGTLKCFDDDRENRNFLARLPDWLVTRWARIAFQWHKDHNGDFPPFKNFADIIAREAKIACNPIYSLQSLKPGQGQNDTHTPNRRTKPGSKFDGRSFFATDVGEQKSESADCKITVSQSSTVSPSHGPTQEVSQCLLCKGQHNLDDCKNFLCKSLSDRKSYVRENNLCFACLRGGHVSKRCRKRKKCRICLKYHPTSLHSDINSQSSQVNPSNQVNPSSQVNHSSQAHIVASEEETLKKEVGPFHSGSAFLSSSGICSKTSMVDLFTFPTRITLLKRDETCVCHA